MLKRIAVLCLAAGVLPAVKAANWVQADPEIRVWYDASSVWSQRQRDDSLLTAAWVIFPQKTESSDDENTSKTYVLFSCGAVRLFKVLQYVVSDKNERTIEADAYQPDSVKWMLTVPDTPSDVAGKALCRLAYNKHMRPKPTNKTPPKQPAGVLL